MKLMEIAEASSGSCASWRTFDEAAACAAGPGSASTRAAAARTARRGRMSLQTRFARETCARRSGHEALDERHLEDLLVHDRAVAEEAGLAEELAVVGGHDDPRVAGQTVEEGREHPVDVADRLHLARLQLAKPGRVE